MLLLVTVLPVSHTIQGARLGFYIGSCWKQKPGPCTEGSSSAFLFPVADPKKLSGCSRHIQVEKQTADTYFCFPGHPHHLNRPPRGVQNEIWFFLLAILLVARIPDCSLKPKDQAGHQSRSLPSTWGVAEGTPKIAQFTQCMLSFFCTCTEAEQWSQAWAIAFLLAFPKSLSQPSHEWDSWMQKACIVKQLRSAAYCLLGGAIAWEGRFVRLHRLYRFLLGGYHLYFCFSIWSPYPNPNWDRLTPRSLTEGWSPKAQAQH